MLSLNLIITGCGTVKSTEFVPASTNTSIIGKSETPTSSEIANLSVNTVTPTLDPSLVNCFATPVSVFGKELLITPAAQEISKTVQKSDEIYAEALRTSNPSKFPTVFINDPRFPVSSGTLDTVRRLSNQPSLQSAGWLDYKMAYFTWQIKEGAFQWSLDTPMPHQTLPPNFVWCGPPPALNFLSLNIDGDIATVVIESCGTTELTLVLVDSHWLIAAYKGLVRCQP